MGGGFGMARSVSIMSPQSIKPLGSPNRSLPMSQLSLAEDNQALGPLSKVDDDRWPEEGKKQ